MKIKSVRIKDFRRFTDLTVDGLPESARLIVLAGPNGTGKSSFFDALYTWLRWTSRKSRSWDNEYHAKAGSSQDGSWNNQVQIDVHGELPNPLKKAVYVRSAYRNDPQFRVSSLEHQGNPLDQVPFTRMIDNDAAVSRNYRRLASKGLVDLWRGGKTTFDDYLNETIGSIHEPMRRLFPDLVLESLGDPLGDGTFYFSKGLSKGFSFMNLSGGEKSAFDLILDLVVARRDYDNTLYCIDEPESHMHSRLQAELLAVLYDLIPADCQLMLATHSIGMMRQARDIERDNPGRVVFLDFGDREFDDPQIIEPTKPDRRFWKTAYAVALGDLAELIAPERVIVCEGEPLTSRPAKHHSLDAECYSTIFGGEFPETEFVSMGNDKDVVNDRRGLAETLHKMINAVKVVRLIDRDDRSNEEIQEANQNGIQVLSRRNIEAYLFDDEVLEKLLALHGDPANLSDLITEKNDLLAKVTDRQPDDIKPASGLIYNACKPMIDQQQRRNDHRAFMRLTLAPLIEPGMSVYDELKRDIFGV